MRTHPHGADARDQLLETIEDAGRRLGVSRSTIYKLIEEKQIETVKIGRAVRIPVDSTITLVQRLRGAA